MEPEKIKILLERFYEGETSREEERLLREFFSRTDVPETLSAEKEHFRLLVQWQSESPLDEAFDAQIMEHVTAAQKSVRPFTGWYALAGVAASVLLVLALWFGNRLNNKSVLPGTTNNPALAYVQARTALQLVSGTLNKGVRPASKAASEITGAMAKTSEIGTLEIAAKPLRTLSEVDRAQQLMESLNSVYINFEPLKK